MTVAATIDARVLPIALIDPPALAMRESFDETKMAELTASIRDVGLIQPISVRRVGDRYEIVAGHRRWFAHRELGLFEIKCVVVDASDEQTEAMKIAENFEREDTNPAEDATYLNEILKRHCDGDLEKLCAMTKRSYTWVSDRLNLLTGDEEIFAHVKAGALGLGAAIELNRIDEVGYRRMYLEHALAGATTKKVREWRQAYERDRAARTAPPSDPNAAPVVVPAVPALAAPRCCVCDREHAKSPLVTVTVHEDCNSAILQPLVDAYRSPRG